ncbi:sulfotransferase [Nocardiopsis coralliicola]
MVFVGGIGRCGSTLIERLLAELPGVCGIGEVVHMWRRSLVDDETCGCGAPFGSCPFWAEVGRVAFGGWDRVDPARILELKDGVDRTRFTAELLADQPSAELVRRASEYTAFYDRLYRAVAQVSGCGVVVDSSKHASLAACLRLRYGARMRLLHVVRDPRGVAHAWRAQEPRPDSGPAGRVRFLARASPTRTAVQWVAQNGVLGALERSGTPTLRIRYEDFTDQPGRELGRIAAFAGCDGGAAGAPEVAPGGAAVLTPGHTVSGGPLRFRTGTVQVPSDAGWPGLGPAGRLAVAALTFPVRRRFGY